MEIGVFEFCSAGENCKQEPKHRISENIHMNNYPSRDRKT
jgi:hypothetical protein